MKTSILNRNGISLQVINLTGRLIDLIPWPQRRSAMGDATLSLLDGKARVAEDVFGWNRGTVELGMNEFRTGIICVNDISKRRRLKVEEKSPKVIGRYSGNHESSQSGGIAFADDAFIYQPNAQSSTWGSFGKGVE